MDWQEHLRLWKEGIVVVEGGCLYLDEDGERCGMEPVIGVEVRRGGREPVAATIDEPRPRIFCDNHGWDGDHDARGLSAATEWQGRKVATVQDGRPIRSRINPKPESF